MKLMLLGGAVLGGLLVAGAVAWSVFGTGKVVEVEGSAHQFSFLTIDGDPLPLEAYKGKAVLLVNTASQCGFTPQYEGLETLWKTYQDKGLVIVGAPSNDFGGQEPGTEAEIKQFCELNFNIQFPMTSKISTKGDDVHPFYAWVRAETGAGPKWNFHKYLITPEGKLVGSFPSAVKPTSTELTKAIEKVLP